MSPQPGAFQTPCPDSKGPETGPLCSSGRALVQGQPCVFTWSKYVRRASISAALASRIWSSKLAKPGALIFVAARCSSSSFLTRLEQSVHWESNSSRSGQLSAISQPFSHAASLQSASTCVTRAKELGVHAVELFVIRNARNKTVDTPNRTIYHRTVTSVLTGCLTIDSGPMALPRKNRRTPKRNFEADISPGLRKHITQAAQKIRRVHETELADILKADRAGRLFRSIIRPDGKAAGSLKETSGDTGEAVEALAGELSGLLTNVIRTGTGLLEAQLTILTQAWMSAAQPNLGTSSAAGPVPGATSQPQLTAASQTPSMAVDTAIPGGQAPGVPPASRGEVMLRGVLRQFMPMVLTALRQGGDGYGLAKTVITLFGRPTYDQVSGLGKDKILQLVKAEPDLWAQVAPIEATFSRFLDEFTGYDAWTAEQER